MRPRRLLAIASSALMLFSSAIGWSAPDDVLRSATTACPGFPSTQTVLADYAVYHGSVPLGEDGRSALADAALAHDDVRILLDHVRSLGFTNAGVVDTYMSTNAGSTVAVAVINHDGPNGATAGVVYATTDTQETLVAAKYQVPEPDPAYRIVTELLVVDGAVSSGPGIRMNSGGPTGCPPGQCRVPKTCGGTTDMGCLAVCQTACAFVPPHLRAACLVACWPACYVPTYNCDYCAPC